LGFHIFLSSLGSFGKENFACVGFDIWLIYLELYWISENAKKSFF